jgi:hypothetical protein
MRLVLPRALALLAALVAAPTALHAQTLVTQPGTTYITRSLSSAATFGASMAGMRVTAHFADGGAASAAWGDLGDGRAGVRTERFRLSVDATQNTGAPFDFVWSLENLFGGGLTRLELRGAPGRTLFDMEGGVEGTPNSALGIPLTFAFGFDAEGNFTPSPYAAGAVVTYRNAVSLVGAAPMGDLWETVDLAFGDALAGGAGLFFDLDTDSVGEGASLDPIDDGSGGGPPVTTTPEPATFALLGGGLLALAGTRARRRTTAS